MKTPNFLSLLRALRKAQVDFIVVGGVSGVLQGAPLTTFDLDIVHARDPANVQRLLAVLEKLHASYRIPGARHQKPQRSHLESTGHQLLITDAGPLDLLGTIGRGFGYSELINDTLEMEVEKGLGVQVLKLEALIDIKAQTAGEKDRAALMILRQTLLEKKGK